MKPVSSIGAGPEGEASGLGSGDGAADGAAVGAGAGLSSAPADPPMNTVAANAIAAALFKNVLPRSMICLLALLMGRRRFSKACSRPIKPALRERRGAPTLW